MWICYAGGIDRHSPSSTSDMRDVRFIERREPGAPSAHILSAHMLQKRRGWKIKLCMR
jgi:hypothetical protein